MKYLWPCEENVVPDDTCTPRRLGAVQVSGWGLDTGETLRALALLDHQPHTDTTRYGFKCFAKKSVIAL